MAVTLSVSANYFESARGDKCGQKTEINLNFSGMRNNSKRVQNKIATKISRTVEKTLINALGVSVSVEVETPNEQSKKIKFISRSMNNTAEAKKLICNVKEIVKFNEFSDNLLELVNKTISIDEFIKISFTYKKANKRQKEAVAFHKMFKLPFYYNGLHPKPDGIDR